MKNIHRKILKRAILIMAPFVFIACEKPNQELGLDQVIGRQAGLKDTVLDVVSYTMNLDSILVALSYDDQLTLGGYSGARMVGSMVDPYFGRAYSSLVSQLILSSVNIDFGTNPVVDSVILNLQYRGAYGDTSIPMNFDVHLIDEDLSRDSLFYSNFTPVTGQLISEPRTIIPAPNTFQMVGGSPLDPGMRIPLNVDYFQQNFANVGDGSFPAFSSNEDFVEYFKGIVVSASTIEGSILYFDLSSNNSGINIYYHNDDKDSLAVRLTYSQSSNTVPIHFSVFDHDYINYPTGFDLSNIDSMNGENRTYVQAMGGVVTVLEVPDLNGFLNEGVLINQAQLDIKKAPGTGSALAPPTNLEIRDFTGNEQGSLIVDFQSGSGQGGFKSEKLKQGYYRFTLTRHIFDVVNGGENLKLAVFPLLKSTVADRVILDGGQLPNDALQMKIYYTKP